MVMSLLRRIKRYVVSKIPVEKRNKMLIFLMSRKLPLVFVRPIINIFHLLCYSYHPVEWGSKCVARSVESRMGAITAFLNLSGILKGRVLDLGCSQGYFSFALARMGFRVDGVDSEQVSVSYCDFINRL